jgi:hypothetical protein
LSERKVLIYWPETAFAAVQLVSEAAFQLVSEAGSLPTETEVPWHVF